MYGVSVRLIIPMSLENPRAYNLVSELSQLIRAVFQCDMVSILQDTHAQCVLDSGSFSGVIIALSDISREPIETQTCNTCVWTDYMMAFNRCYR